MSYSTSCDFRERKEKERERERERAQSPIVLHRSKRTTRFVLSSRFTVFSWPLVMRWVRIVFLRTINGYMVSMMKETSLRRIIRIRIIFVGKVIVIVDSKAIPRNLHNLLPTRALWIRKNVCSERLQ